MRIEHSGENLVVDAGGSLFWVEAKVLMIADTHWGKEDYFRRHGIPVPPGMLTADLERLSRLIGRYAPTELVVLGDLFHRAEACDVETLTMLRGWREGHAGLPIRSIRGNHDRGIDENVYGLDIQWEQEGYFREPFALHHHPVADGRGTTICGHLHPGVSVPTGMGRGFRKGLGAAAGGKFPAFVFQERCIILPAFGRFTGKAPYRPARGDRIVLIVDDQVMLLPSALMAGDRRAGDR